MCSGVAGPVSIALIRMAREHYEFFVLPNDSGIRRELRKLLAFVVWLTILDLRKSDCRIRPHCDVKLVPFAIEGDSDELSNRKR